MNVLNVMHVDQGWYPRWVLMHLFPSLGGGHFFMYLSCVLFNILIFRFFVFLGSFFFKLAIWPYLSWYRVSQFRSRINPKASTAIVCWGYTYIINICFAITWGGLDSRKSKRANHKLLLKTSFQKNHTWTWTTKWSK
jgi:hypothetical protein